MVICSERATGEKGVEMGSLGFGTPVWRLLGIAAASSDGCCAGEAGAYMAGACCAIGAGGPYVTGESAA